MFLAVSPPSFERFRVFNTIADAIEIMFVCLGILSLTLATVVYGQLNARRARRQVTLEIEETLLSDEELRAMGDRAPDFRYSL